VRFLPALRGACPEESKGVEMAAFAKLDEGLAEMTIMTYFSVDDLPK